MASQEISITINPTDIQVTTGPVNVNLTASTISSSSVNEGDKLYLDGVGGTTYLTKNATTQRVELWVNGVKQNEWGAYSGSDPFA